MNTTEVEGRKGGKNRRTLRNTSTSLPRSFGAGWKIWECRSQRGSVELPGEELARVCLQETTLSPLRSFRPAILDNEMEGRRDESTRKRKKREKKGFCVKQRCVPKIFRLLLGLYYIPGQRRTELSSAIGSPKYASMCAKFLSTYCRPRLLVWS